MKTTALKLKKENSEKNLLARFDFAVKFAREDDSNEDFLLGELRRVILKKFTPKVQSIFGKKVSIEVGDLEIGSVFGEVLIFGAGIGIYEIIALYPDFINGLQLLKGQLGEILNAAIIENGQQPTRTQVGIAYIAPLPTQTNLPVPPPFYSKFFFWYLLVANIFLTGIITWLVYRALVTVYFGTP